MCVASETSVSFRRSTANSKFRVPVSAQTMGLYNDTDEVSMPQRQIGRGVCWRSHGPDSAHAWTDDICGVPPRRRIPALKPEKMQM